MGGSLSLDRARSNVPIWGRSCLRGNVFRITCTSAAEGAAGTNRAQAVRGCDSDSKRPRSPGGLAAKSALGPDQHHVSAGDIGCDENWFRPVTGRSDTRDVGQDRLRPGDQSVRAVGSQRRQVPPAGATLFAHETSQPSGKLGRLDGRWSCGEDEVESFEGFVTVWDDCLVFGACDRGADGGLVLELHDSDDLGAVVAGELVDAGELACEGAAGLHHDRYGDAAVFGVVVVGVWPSGSQDDELHGHGVWSFVEVGILE